MPHRWVKALFPLPRRGGVYALYRCDELVYIGHAGNLRVRFNKHMRTQQIDAVKIALVADRRERQRIERRLLFRLRPSGNRVLPSVLRPFGFYKGC